MEENNVKSSIVHRCDKCSGDMQYSPKDKALKCIFCGHAEEIEIAEDAIVEKKLVEDIKDEDTKGWSKETRVIQCSSCGGETVLEGNQTSVACVFCGSTHTQSLEDNNIGLKPTGIIMFEVEKNQVQELHKKWIKKLWFRPSKLKNHSSVDLVNGIYIPYWGYDSDTNSQFNGQRGTYYYVTKKVDGKEVKERKIKWRPVSGSVNEKFVDILTPGTKRETKELMRKVEPFQLEKLFPYDDRYLSGFISERYSINVLEGLTEAKKIMDVEIDRQIRRKIGGDSQRVDMVSTMHKETKFRHFLVPLWVSTYRFGDKAFNFVVNGQTGKVSGKAPYSPMKIIVFILVLLAIAAGVIYFTSMK